MSNYGKFIMNILPYIRKAWDLAKAFIYTKAEFSIYKNGHEVEVESPAIVKSVDNSNVNDILSFNSEQYVDIFKRFLDMGDKGYYAYLNGECVHRSWVKRGPQEIRFMRDYLIKLNEDDVYVHYCVTSEKARGMNIYPAVLSQICRDYQGKNIYLLVSNRKDYAIRGVEKAGFEKAKCVSFRRILGFTRIYEVMFE